MNISESATIRLIRLQIENFRGVENLEVLFGDENFIIGNNGTGKTTMLAAIARLMPALRGENRLFLDADFNFQGTSAPSSIKLTYTIEILDQGRVQQLIIEITGNRKNLGLNRSHLNAQESGEFSILVKDPSGNDQQEIIKQLKERSLLKQRIIRNGWGGGRIAPIFLPKELSHTRHAATNMQEEQGSYDALRARYIELLKDTELGKKVKQSHPNLVDNTLRLTNQFLGEGRFKNVALAHSDMLTLEREDGVIQPWDQISGGEQSAFNLAASIEFEGIEKSQFVILEEPETTIHPSLQIGFLSFIKSKFPDKQIFISTHSPYLFLRNLNRSKLLITRRENDSIKVMDATSASFGLLSWSPSWGEINYFAYNIPTIEFHNDLYSALQERESLHKVFEIENWFVTTKQFSKEITWTEANGRIKNETLMTYIRNKIHHFDNLDRPTFSESQLNESISRMINLLKNP